MISSGRATLIALALVLGACRRTEPVEQSPEAGAAAPRFDARRLADEQARFAKRFSAAPALGDCARFLGADEARDCVSAGHAREQLVQALAKPTPGESLAKAASMASYAAIATRSLRFESLRRVGKTRELVGADGGAPPPLTAPPAGSRAAVVLDEHEHAPALVADDPMLPLIRGYAGATTDALRYAGMLLQKAELPTRVAAFEAIERFAKTHPEWGEPAKLVREAALFEKDAALLARLNAFAKSPPSLAK